MENRRFLAIEIGGTKLQICAGLGDGQIVERQRFDIDPASGAEGIRRQISTALPALSAAHRPAAIGVGFGGPVDVHTGRIACSHQIAGWSEFPLADWLREQTGLPVAIENDANAAALGEALRGAGQGFDPVFYANFGSGVGGGLVVNKSIYHGAPPGEVEFGHLRLDRNGQTVEDRCSGWNVNRRLVQIADEQPHGELARLIATHRGQEAVSLPILIERHDPAALQVLDELTTDIAFGLSHVVHLFHPAIIVLGGGLSHLGEPFRAHIAKKLPDGIMEVFRPGPRIALSALGPDIVPTGSLLLAHNAFLKSIT